MLGSGDRWHVLYQVNRDMLNDPHSITPGQTLTLPQ
jgi:nucleoid-associated protein YgaU